MNCFKLIVKMPIATLLIVLEFPIYIIIFKSISIFLDTLAKSFFSVYLTYAYKLGEKFK